jgi:hypothetical protein
MSIKSALSSEKADAELVLQFRVPYSFLRKQLQNLSPEVKAAVAKYEKLDTLIWYYEELSCQDVNIIISERLAAGEEPQFSYGKVRHFSSTRGEDERRCGFCVLTARQLMERLLYFKLNDVPFWQQLVPIAEKRLRQIKARASCFLVF